MVSYFFSLETNCGRWSAALLLWHKSLGYMSEKGRMISSLQYEESKARKYRSQLLRTMCFDKEVKSNFCKSSEVIRVEEPRTSAYRCLRTHINCLVGRIVLWSDIYRWHYMFTFWSTNMRFFLLSKYEKQWLRTRWTWELSVWGIMEASKVVKILLIILTRAV